jgi:hypothetical protein
MVFLLIAAALVLALSSGAEAQTAGRRVRVIHSNAAQTQPGSTATAPPTVIPRASLSLPQVTGSSLARTPVFSSMPVPGLGFDYAHLAASARNTEKRGLTDPVTLHRLAQEERLRRQTPAAAASPLILIPITNVVIVQPPPVIVIDEPAPAAQAAAPWMVAGPASAAVAPAVPEMSRELSPPPVPPIPLEEILLVRRDGARLAVVAFSQNDARIVYITREGLRRSLTLAELDLDATTLVNEERGVIVKIRSEFSKL